jgi:hypothetical protein
MEKRSCSVSKQEGRQEYLQFSLLPFSAALSLLSRLTLAGEERGAFLMA